MFQELDIDLNKGGVCQKEGCWLIFSSVHVLGKSILLSVPEIPHLPY